MDKIFKITKRYLNTRLGQALEDQVEPIKELIMDGYDTLSVKVADPKSKTNPELFRDQFAETLEAFDYIDYDEESIILGVPDMNKLDLSGIPIVRQILEGTVGTFVEISHEDLVKLTGKSTINNDPIDSSVTKQKRIYLVKYDDKIRRGEKEILNKKLIKFPFSNTPALDDTVFGPADDYVNNNISKWIESTLKTSTKEISQKYGKV